MMHLHEYIHRALDTMCIYIYVYECVECAGWMCSLVAVARLVEPSVQIQGSATLSADESIVYIGSWDYNLYAVHTADGTQKWAFATGGQVSAGWCSVDAMRLAHSRLVAGYALWQRCLAGWAPYQHQCSLSLAPRSVCVCVRTRVCWCRCEHLVPVFVGIYYIYVCVYTICRAAACNA